MKRDDQLLTIKILLATREVPLDLEDIVKDKIDNGITAAEAKKVTALLKDCPLRDYTSKKRFADMKYSISVATESAATLTSAWHSAGSGTYPSQSAWDLRG
jgi:hypothetical protein